MRRHLAMRLAEMLFVLMLLGVGFLLGVALQGCDGNGLLQHRAKWEVDPQGQGENLGRADCLRAGRIPYNDEEGAYIYCMRITR